MTPCCGNFEPSPGKGLSSNLSQVGLAIELRMLDGAWRDDFECCCATQMIQYLGERVGTEARDACDGGDLRGVFHRCNEPLKSALTCVKGHGKRTPNTSQPPIESKLAKDECAFEGIRSDLSLSHEDAQCDGEIVCGAFLPQVSGGEIDDDTFLRKGESSVLHRRLHPSSSFDDCSDWQPHGGEEHHARAQIDLDFDGPGLYAQQCG